MPDRHAHENENASCGAELAQSAVVPDLLGALFAHVARGLEVHAEWVGAASEAACLERDTLREVAADYRTVAEAAARAAKRMRAAASLAAPPHDPETWDRVAFVGWMRRKLALQRSLAELLLEHARASELALEHM